MRTLWFVVTSLLLLSSLCMWAPSALAADDGAWLEKAAEARGSRRASIRARSRFSAASPRSGPRIRRRSIASPRSTRSPANTKRRSASIVASPRVREADPARKARAESEATRLDEAPAPFAETALSSWRAAPPTRRKRLFDEGKKDAQAKTTSSRRSTSCRRRCYSIPICPAPIDFSARSTARPATSAQERRFLADYLRVRPDGKIADTVRTTLAKEHVLGSISVDASFPCKVYINGRETGPHDAAQEVTRCRRASYIVSLENEQFHIVRQPASST